MPWGSGVEKRWLRPLFPSSPSRARAGARGRSGPGRAGQGRDGRFGGEARAGGPSWQGEKRGRGGMELGLE